MAWRISRRAEIQVWSLHSQKQSTTTGGIATVEHYPLPGPGTEHGWFCWAQGMAPSGSLPPDTRCFCLYLCQICTLWGRADCPYPSCKGVWENKIWLFLWQGVASCGEAVKHRRANFDGHPKRMAEPST